MEKDRKKRLYELLRSIGTVAALVAAYFLIMPFTDFRIECPVYKIFKIHCPGCGLTRMLSAMLRLDFAAAFGHNMLLFCLLPFIIFFAVMNGVKYVKYGNSKISKLEMIFYIIAFVLAIVFAILRNLPAFEFLAP